MNHCNIWEKIAGCLFSGKKIEREKERKKFIPIYSERKLWQKRDVTSINICMHMNLYVWIVVGQKVRWIIMQVEMADVIHLVKQINKKEMKTYLNVWKYEKKIIKIAKAWIRFHLCTRNVPNLNGSTQSRVYAAPPFLPPIAFSCFRCWKFY